MSTSHQPSHLNNYWYVQPAWKQQAENGCACRVLGLDIHTLHPPCWSSRAQHWWKRKNMHNMRNTERICNCPLQSCLDPCDSWMDGRLCKKGVRYSFHVRWWQSLNISLCSLVVPHCSVSSRSNISRNQWNIASIWPRIQLWLHYTIREAIC